MTEILPADAGPNVQMLAPKHETVMVNLFGGPGSGKSTMAADLFQRLKSHHVSCELVPEWAKDRVYDGTKFPLDPITVWALSRRRCNRPLGQVAVVITDGPPLIAAAFDKMENVLRYPVKHYFHQLAVADHRQRSPRLDVFVSRRKVFHRAGRHVTEAQAHEMDEIQHRMLVEVSPQHYITVPGDSQGAEVVYDAIMSFEGAQDPDFYTRLGRV